jgi:hypothetical protein
MIAETLLLEAFHALDQMPHSPRVRKLLRRVDGGVWPPDGYSATIPTWMRGQCLSRRGEQKACKVLTNLSP